MWACLAVCTAMAMSNVMVDAYTFSSRDELVTAADHGRAQGTCPASKRVYAFDFISEYLRDLLKPKCSSWSIFQYIL